MKLPINIGKSLLGSGILMSAYLIVTSYIVPTKAYAQGCGNGAQCWSSGMPGDGNCGYLNGGCGCVLNGANYVNPLCS